MSPTIETFLFAFAFFILVIICLALGFIFKRRVLQGSCGGLTTMGMKKVCDCEEPCDNLKEKVALGEITAAELARFSQKTEKGEKTEFYEVK